MNATVLATPRSLLARISRRALLMGLVLVAFGGNTPAAKAAEFVDSVAVAHPSGIVGTVASVPEKCRISATLQNVGPVSVKVTLVTYRLTEPSCAPIREENVSLLKSQFLFDYKTVMVPAGASGFVVCSVAVPCCAAQWDLVLGDVLPQFVGSDFYQAFHSSPLVNRVIMGAFTYECKMLSPWGCVTYEMLRDCDEVICTYTQGGYSQLPRRKNVGSFLRSNFADQFPRGLFIGASSPAGIFVYLKSPTAIRQFIRGHNGTPGVLNSTRQGGTFASQVVTLTLNIAFNPRFGGLLICNTGTSLDAQTVTQVLAIANAVIGNLPGELPSGYTVSALNDLVTNLNESHQDGTLSAWGYSHLCEPETELAETAAHHH